MSRNGEIVLVVHSFTVHKSAWKDAQYNGSSDSFKEGNPDTWRYTRLKMFQKNEESGEYEPAPYWLWCW